MTSTDTPEPSESSRPRLELAPKVDQKLLHRVNVVVLALILAAIASGCALAVFQTAGLVVGYPAALTAHSLLMMAMLPLLVFSTEQTRAALLASIAAAGVYLLGLGAVWLTLQIGATISAIALLVLAETHRRRQAPATQRYAVSGCYLWLAACGIGAGWGWPCTSSASVVAITAAYLTSQRQRASGWPAAALVAGAAGVLLAKAGVAPTVLLGLLGGGAMAWRVFRGSIQEECWWLRCCGGAQGLLLFVAFALASVLSLLTLPKHVLADTYLVLAENHVGVFSAVAGMLYRTPTRTDRSKLEVLGVVVSFAGAMLLIAAQFQLGRLGMARRVPAVTLPLVQTPLWLQAIAAGIIAAGISIAVVGVLGRKPRPR